MTGYLCVFPTLCYLESLLTETARVFILVNNSCASSKHLQTRRFLDTIAQYLMDAHKLVVHSYRLANERTDAFTDHSGNLIDSRTGAPLVLHVDDEEEQDAQEAVGEDGETPGVYTGGYSFFDSVSDLMH